MSSTSNPVNGGSSQPLVLLALADPVVWAAVDPVLVAAAVVVLAVLVVPVVPVAPARAGRIPGESGHALRLRRRSVVGWLELVRVWVAARAAVEGLALPW